MGDVVRLFPAKPFDEERARGEARAFLAAACHSLHDMQTAEKLNQVMFLIEETKDIMQRLIRNGGPQ
jgi:hypothetical protein